MRINRNIIKRYKLFFIILFIFFFAAEINQNEFKNFAYAKLDELKLLPKDEHFTELYFNNPNFIFEKAVPGENINYSFTIHNMTGEDKEYYYMVYFESDSDTVGIIDQNMIFVSSDEKEIIQGSYFMKDNGVKKIYVELPELKQKIHIIINNKYESAN